MLCISATNPRYGTQMDEAGHLEASEGWVFVTCWTDAGITVMRTHVLELCVENERVSLIEFERPKSWGLVSSSRGA